MHFLALAPLVASVALALPTSESTGTGEPIARTHQFGIVLGAKAPYNGLVLRASDSGVVGGKYLSFERPSAYSPTPAFLNGTHAQLSDPGQFAWLDFVSDNKADYGKIYRTNLPEAGHAYGNVQDVQSALHGGNAAWKLSADGKTLHGRLTATMNQFFACNTTIPRKVGNLEVLGLKWGNDYYNGTTPAGCIPATLNVVPLSYGTKPE